MFFLIYIQLSFMHTIFIDVSAMNLNIDFDVLDKIASQYLETAVERHLIK